MSWFADLFSYLDSASKSPSANTVIDSLILVTAAIPVVYVCAVFLFGDARRAQQLLRSPALKGWLIFFCIFEVILHSFKISIVLKIAVIVAAILVFIPLFVVKEIVG